MSLLPSLNVNSCILEVGKALKLRSFGVTIRNANPKNLDHKESIDFFKEEVDRYFTLFKDHLDYVPEEYIKKEILHSFGMYYDISISSDFFN